MEETHAQYEELLKASHAQNFTSTLKVTSSTDGFRVMDPFDWTADKSIYQRWQLWSHKARLALDAMEGDNEKTKISYLHHWLDGKGISKIKGWRNSKTLITQAEYDALEERDRKGKYSLDKVESYFSLGESILTPRSNPLLAVEELHLAKQGSMTSEEFYSQILEIVKRCRFPNQEAEDRAVRDAIFIGMNSQRAKDKAINLMTEEEGKEVTVEFLLNHLAVEDGNTQHRFLSQLDSNTSMNMVAYDRRQNKGKSNRSRNNNGREREQNKSRVQTSSSTAQPSRKPPGMEGKCMRCGRSEHQQGEKCAARNANCKDCHKTGHFYKVCQSSKRTRRANLAQVTPQDEDDTCIDECGYTQPNPPVVNMLKVINHTDTTSGTKFLKFPIDVDPRGSYKHHLEVSIDTGADVNCMNEKTFKKLLPEVELSVCPHSIQNFGNSTADVYILGQFCTYLQFRRRKYLNTFIVTNANDCPNILSHGAIFRMGILVPNYPKENMVKLGDMETGTSNVFQVLQDLRMKQYQGNSEPKAHRPSTTFTTSTTRQPKVSKSCKTASQKAGTAIYIDNTSQIQTSFRTMPPPKTSADGTIPTPEFKANTTHSTRRPASRTHQLISHLPQTCCMHVHQQQSHTCKTGEPPALREVKHPHRDRTSVSRSSPTEQEVLSQFSGYSEEIEHFTRDPCTTQLKSCIQSTKHASKKQEVNTCTNCEHSYRMEHAEHFSAPMEMCMDDHLTQITERIQRQHLQDKTYEQNCLTHNILPDSNFSHAEFPPGMENTQSFLGKQFLQGKETITRSDMENMPALLWNQSIQGNEKNVDTCTFIPGSTTPSRHSTLSTLTHPRRVPQNFQQLEKENSNTVALPDFNHNAEATTHIETSRNVHNNGTLSTSLRTDTNMHANMDTNHIAHRYRHTGKEVHLLSEPSELRPLKAMAHRHIRKEVHLLSEPSELQPLKAMAHQYTRKEAHLLSGPSELQPTEDSETQKFDSAHVQQSRQEYSRSTETNKVKFQIPFIYNDERNFIWHNSVDKISPNLVFMTTPNTSSVSNSVFFRKKGRKCRNCRECTCSRSTCTCSHTGDSP